MESRQETYWKTFLGIPRYKIDWYFKYYLYKITGFTFDKLKDQKHYWNTRGKQYYRDFFDSECWKYEIFFQDLLIEELRKLEFSSIFEVGCGFGWNVKRIKREMPGVAVSGVDFSLPQLQNSLIYDAGIRIPAVLSEACLLPFRDDAFDIGFTMGVFMNVHSKKIGSAIDELLRVSKKYIVHLEWDQNNTTPELRERRIFKTNIVSHDYPALYKQRGKKIIKFLNYRDFQDAFFKRFPTTKVKTWEQFDGPEKYILSVIEV